MMKHVEMPLEYLEGIVTDQQSYMFVKEDKLAEAFIEYAKEVCDAFYPRLKLLQSVRSETTLWGIRPDMIRDWVRGNRCP